MRTVLFAVFGCFTLSVLAQPANDDCAAAPMLSMNGVSANLAQATRDGGTTPACGTGAAPDVWYRYQAATGGRVVFVLDSNYLHALSLHDPAINGCPGEADDQLACATGSGPPGPARAAAVDQTVVAGQELLVRVGGASGNVGLGDYTIRAVRPPAFDRCDTPLPFAGSEVMLGHMVATADGDATCSVPPADGLRDLWVEFTPVDTGTYVASTRGSSRPIAIAVHAPGSGCPGPRLPPVCSNDEYTFAATGGQRYLVRLAIGAGADPLRLRIERTGSIAGVVRDAQSLQPIAGAQLQVFRIPAPLGSEPVRTVGVDGNGAFLAADLAPGEYGVRTVSVFGHQMQIHQGLPCTGDCSPDGGTPIRVDPGTQVSGINFDLLPRGTLSGRVVDAQGLPLSAAGAGVVAFGASGSVSLPVDLDAAGEYRFGAFAALSGGEYRLLATVPGYVPQWYVDAPCPPPSPCASTNATPVTVGWGEATTGIDFRLRSAAGAIQGTLLRASNGQPLPGVQVTLYDSQGLQVASTESSGNTLPEFVGTFRFEGLPAGTYHLLGGFIGRTSSLVPRLYGNLPCPFGVCTVTEGAPIVVAGGLTTTGIDVAIGTGSRVTGEVRDEASGGLLDAATVEFFDAQGRFLTSAGAPMHAFEIDGFAAGTYFVRTVDSARIDELWDNIPCPDQLCEPTLGTPLVLGDTGVRGNVDFALGLPGSISVQVRDAATLEALAGATIRLHDANGNLRRTIESTQQPVALDALEPGSYTVSASLGDGYDDRLYVDVPCAPNACDPALGAQITVTSGAVTRDIEIRLQRQTAPPLQLLALPLPAAIAEQPYVQALAVEGGTPPYGLALVAGSLPRGMMLAPDGTLSGVPNESGTARFSVRVTDGEGRTAQRSFELLVQCNVRFIGAEPGAPIAGEPYAQALAASGGTPAFRYVLASGSLPIGLTLSTSGLISGNPPLSTAGLPFAFNVQASDATGCTALAAFEMVVRAVTVFADEFE